MAVSLTSKVRLVLLDINGFTYRYIVEGLSFPSLEIVIKTWIVWLWFGDFMGWRLWL